MSSLSQTAYEQIRRRITSGEWTAETPLSEPSLAEELKISRTPIREAIHRLENEGLLEQRHRQGTFLRRPSRLEMSELFEVRIVLEPFAVGRAARYRDPELLRQLAGFVAEMRRTTALLQADGAAAEKMALFRRHAQADHAFHEAILQHARNRSIHKLVNSASVMTRIWSGPKVRPDKILSLLRRDADRDHAQILRTIRGGDRVAARSAMRAHLIRGRKHAMDYFDWLEEQTKSTAERRRR